MHRPDPRKSRTPRTIGQLCDQAQAWADVYYSQSRNPYNIRDALRALRAVTADQPVSAIAAETLYDCQGWMLVENLSRKVINNRINRIRLVCRWAARPPRRWLTAAQLTDLSLVEPLKRGRTEAREAPGIAPVDWETVSTTIAAADLELATAIELHWQTGMRPGELIGMTRDALTAKGPDLWPYQPAKHKTSHHGHRRVIPIGPNGLSVLRPWLQRLPPERGRLWRWTRPGGYRTAIRWANRNTGVTWTPAQIRHAAATRIRATADLEAARVILGHRHASTTEIYAEQDLARAIEFIRKHG